MSSTSMQGENTFTAAILTIRELKPISHHIIVTDGNSAKTIKTKNLTFEMSHFLSITNKQKNACLPPMAFLRNLPKKSSVF